MPAFFEIPAPDSDRARRRIEVMERDAMLPIKLVLIGIVLFSFNYQSKWFSNALNALTIFTISVEMVQFLFGCYIVANIFLAIPIIAGARVPLALLQWTVVTSALTDGVLLAGMTLITGGLDSILFWLFIALILRNSVSVPPGFSQLFLNFAISLCYVLVGVLNQNIIASLDDTSRRAMGDSLTEDLGELFFLRLLVLWLVAFVAYSAQAFLERQRIALEEAREFAAREGQLHSAGRLAAEFAHQIKNPLAIIRNASHSLERSVRENKPSSFAQIEIIREEVAHADKVIEQIMGYAQLSEGRVEKLDVQAKIEKAVQQVFPVAVPTDITVELKLSGPFPPLLMQRGHLSEILVNLLQNAREALEGRGKIIVTARTLPDHAVEISVADDGPGIPPEKRERIFEAYFTTKKTGTGLGLAIVKHNAELYGGTVRVESELEKSTLGRGATFIVTFPEKSLPKPFVK